MKNENLINARKKKGLTQTELAKKVNVKKSTVSNWENNHSLPPMKRAFEVAKILDSDIDHLFYDKKNLQ